MRFLSKGKKGRGQIQPGLLLAVSSIVILLFAGSVKADAAWPASGSGSAILIRHNYYSHFEKLLTGTGFHILRGQTVISSAAPYYFTPGGALYAQEGDGEEERDLSALKKELSSVISGYSGEWSVYVRDLKGGDTIIINDTPMYAASTIKAFAMAYTYELIAQGRLEKTEEVKKLLTRMITISDNTSFNQLVALWYGGDFLRGARSLNAYLRENGYTETSLHHTIRPASGAHITDGQRNTASAKDCGLLLERIENGTCVNRACSREMKKLLLDQQRTYKIPASLPPTAVTANKTGETTEVQHDIAIVSGLKCSYIICVFSTTSQSNGINGIKKISRTVWDQLEQ